MRHPIVVLDTNMLILAASGVRVFEDIEEQLETKPRFIVLKAVYDELVRLSREAPPSVRKKAVLALELIQKFCEVVEYGGSEHHNVDDLILKFALENKAIVASSDRELRARARRLGIPEAYLREESMRVVVEGYFR